jgi:chromosomal replication initiator protein
MSEPSTVPDLGPWDDLIEGPENALALAGVRALARGEREGISPLVVHGPSGVGKSRLLSGLVADRLRRRPGASAAHVDAETFAAGCAAAAKADLGAGWTEFRVRFREVDLLVLEDLDGLLRAPLALEELIYTLDALDERGSSVAVSTRTGPGYWGDLGWPTRLVNRLRGGLAVRIDPPGPDALRRYLLQQAETRRISLAADVVETLAQSADGYRTLDGWLTRLALGIRVDARGVTRTQNGTPRLDQAEATAILSDETALASPSLTIEQVARKVAERYRIKLRELRGPSRRAAIAEPRHLAMHLARLHTDASFAVIGTYFGKRDPATVRHACKAAADRLKADPPLAAEVAAWFVKQGSA